MQWFNFLTQCILEQTLVFYLMDSTHGGLGYSAVAVRGIQCHRTSIKYL